MSPLARRQEIRVHRDFIPLLLSSAPSCVWTRIRPRPTSLHFTVTDKIVGVYADSAVTHQPFGLLPTCRIATERHYLGW